MKFKKRLLFLFLVLISVYAKAEEFNYEEQIKKYEEQITSRDLSPIEVSIKMAKKELDAWEGLKARLDIFSSATKALYDPTVSPFHITKAESSNPNSFEATTLPSSLSVGEHSIHVIELAMSDIISSKAFRKSDKIRGSVFSIKTENNKEISIDFSKGGNLEELHNTFEKTKNDFLKTTLTKIDDKSSVLLIRSLKTGFKNRLALVGDKAFFNEVGFFREKIDRVKKEESYINLDGAVKDIINGSYSMPNNKTIVLDTDTKLLLKLKPTRITKTLIFDAEARSEEEAKLMEKKTKATPPKEKIPIGSTESLRIGRIMIYSTPLIHDFDRSEKKDSKKDDTLRKDQDSKFKQSISFIGNKKNNVINTFAIQFKEKGIYKTKPKQKTINKWQKIRINIAKEDLTQNEGNFLSALSIENIKARHKLIIRNISIYDPFQSSRENNYNFVEKARDANIIFNGLNITRSSNRIDDLLKGVSINLKAPSDEAAILKLSRDYDKTAEYIDKFSSEYNNLMLYIKNLREYVPRRTLDDLEKEEEDFNKRSFEEKEYSKLSGEIYKGVIKDSRILRSLKDTVRSYMINTPYKRLSDKKIKFLFQIGFKNSSSPFEASGNTENLNAGYLYLDKNILKGKLKQYFSEIKELFAHSVGDSFIKDNGIAINIVKTLSSYSNRTIRNKDGLAYPGPIEMRKIALTKRQIYLESRFENMEKRVDKKISQFRFKIEKLKSVRKEGDRDRKQFESIFKGLGQ